MDEGAALLTHLLVSDRPTLGAFRVDPSSSIKRRVWEHLLSREKAGAECSSLREGHAMEALFRAGA